MNRQKPPIIIGEKLVSYFDAGIEEITKIFNALLEYESLGGLTAAYLYAYSIYEGTLFQIYRKVLKAFPNKANLEIRRIDQGMLFKTSRTSVIIDQLCDAFSRNFGHDSFNKYIENFNNVVGVDLSSVKFMSEEMDDFKLNRNKLAHRNGNGVLLNLSQSKKHLLAAVDTLKLVRDKFILKYSQYTDIKLIKESCSYVFNMFENEFYECFAISDGHVRIKLKPIEKVYSRLSSSERHCFLLFIANYNAGISKEFKVGDLMPRVSLSNDTIDRISFITDLFDEYPHLINR